MFDESIFYESEIHKQKESVRINMIKSIITENSMIVHDSSNTSQNNVSGRNYFYFSLRNQNSDVLSLNLQKGIKNFKYKPE